MNCSCLPEMVTHTALLCELQMARSETDRLFTHLNPRALYDRPIAERHRIIFYLGHLEAFDWNQIKQAGMEQPSTVPEFDRLFAFGIDPEPGKLPHDQPWDWPTVDQVRKYNDDLRQKIDAFLPSVPADQISMMVEHRHMHAETFAYILHSLDHSQKQGPSEPPGDAFSALPSERPELIQIPQGAATLGRARDEEFGWDNEYLETQVAVPGFAISKYKVTNGDWLEFMKLTGAAAPYYWFQQQGQWLYRGVFEDVPLPLDWPVYVSHQQASQYARFRNLDLPTEAQFHRAAYGGGEQEREYPWGHTAADLSQHGNFGYQRWNPVPVNSSPQTESEWGVAQLVGNGWEWTSTIFAPFPGFQPRPSYPGYSSDFFDDSHYVIKGASQRTAHRLVRRSLRNWFRPEYPYVYGTFHLVKN